MQPDEKRGEHEALARRFFDSISQKKIEEFGNIFSEDAVQINPYAPPGFPKTFQGRQALIDHYDGAVRTRKSHSFEISQVHHTLDPDVMIVQLNGSSEVPETGETYGQHYIVVFTFRDGRIKRMEEYFNPLVLVKAFGGSVDSLNEIMGHEKTA